MNFVDDFRLGDSQHRLAGMVRDRVNEAIVLRLRHTEDAVPLTQPLARVLDRVAAIIRFSDVQLTRDDHGLNIDLLFRESPLLPDLFEVLSPIELTILPPFIEVLLALQNEDGD